MPQDRGCKESFSTHTLSCYASRNLREKAVCIPYLHVLETMLARSMNFKRGRHNESDLELLPPEDGRKPPPRLFTSSTKSSSLGSRLSHSSTFGLGDASPKPSTSAPRKLGRRGGMVIVWLVWDILLCCVPLSFLVLAGMTSALSGAKVSLYGQRVIEWSLLVCECSYLWGLILNVSRDPPYFHYFSRPLLGGL
jgi:hypothetical protein